MTAMHGEGVEAGAIAANVTYIPHILTHLAKFFAISKVVAAGVKLFSANCLSRITHQRGKGQSPACRTLALYSQYRRV